MVPESTGPDDPAPQICGPEDVHVYNSISLHDCFHSLGWDTVLAS